MGMTHEMLTGYHVDVNRVTADVVRFYADMRVIYSYVDCQCVDMLTRYIEGVPFTFIVDVEGPLKPDCRVSAVDIEGKATFVGNLLISATDEENRCLRSLTDDELDILERNTELCLVQPSGSKHRYNVWCVCGVDYGGSMECLRRMSRWRSNRGWTT